MNWVRVCFGPRTVPSPVGVLLRPADDMMRKVSFDNRLSMRLAVVTGRSGAPRLFLYVRSGDRDRHLGVLLKAPPLAAVSESRVTSPLPPV